MPLSLPKKCLRAVTGWIIISKVRIIRKNQLCVIGFTLLSGAIFGVNEFSVRLPSILAGLATVLITCALGARIYSFRTGLLAGYIMASMMGFVNLSRLARIDIVLCAFYTASMYPALYWIFRER